LDQADFKTVEILGHQMMGLGANREAAYGIASSVRNRNRSEKRFAHLQGAIRQIIPIPSSRNSKLRFLTHFKRYAFLSKGISEEVLLRKYFETHLLAWVCMAASCFAMPTVSFAADVSAVNATVPLLSHPVKAPPVASLYDWTGFYVGGHMGYAGETPTGRLTRRRPDCHRPPAWLT
jgi:hypothetical protein